MNSLSGLKGTNHIQITFLLQDQNDETIWREFKEIIDTKGVSAETDIDHLRKIYEIEEMDKGIWNKL